MSPRRRTKKTVLFRKPTIYIATFVREKGRPTDAVELGDKVFPKGQGVRISAEEKAVLERQPNLVFTFVLE